jgi:pyruvate dehydrogenase E1 component
VIPFYIFYSMFGLQRIGDLIWAAGDIQTRGFLLGGTAGRTTLAGEGLQHQDGNSHLLAFPIPNLRTYDPAYAYELAVILRDGLERMHAKQESVFYYITLMNENYAQPPMPEGVEEGILRGIYRLRSAGKSGKVQLHLLGSGTILNEAVKAQELLAEKFGIHADVWSVTSYKELHRDALACARWNRLHPEEAPRIPYVTQVFGEGNHAFAAASDYVKALPESIAAHLPGPLHMLGTDGFGRSDGRKELRDFFEVDARHIAQAVLWQLMRTGEMEASAVSRALAELKIDAEKAEPVHR